MSTRELRLQVTLTAIDKASANLRRIGSGGKELARTLKESRDRLKELNDQQRNVAAFREVRAGLRDTSAQLVAAQQKVRDLAQQMGQVGAPTRAMTREFNAAKRSAAELGEQHDRQSRQSQELRDRLTAAGVSVKALGSHERALRSDIDATTKSVDAQLGKLKQMADRQKALAAIDEHRRQRSATAHAVALRGAVTTGAGLGVARALHAPINESKEFYSEQQRIAALGLGEKVTEDAVAYAKGMKTYGTSTRDNLALMRDGLSIFADLHHAEMVAPTLAKMKFANEAIFGAEKGHENEKKFMDMLKVIELRGGLENEKTFLDQANKIQRVIAATGGRVQGEEWLNVIKTGGVAAKGLTDEALYYQMEPLVQEMGGHRVGTAMMSAYQNVYQGKTTKRAANLLDSLGLIADRSQVKHDKVGQIAQLGVGALKGSDVFRHNQFEWMEQILLPALAAKGITEKQQVLDAMGGIFSNRTASGLFAQMYLQRDQIRKNAKLNAGADGIDQLYLKAKDSPSGKEMELAKRKENAYQVLGDKIMPAYTWALEKAAAALTNLTAWMEANPRTARAVAVGLGVIAVAMVTIGGLLLVVAPVLLTLASMRWALATLGVQGSVFSRVLGVMGTALQFVRVALLWVARALLMNPIGLTITGIALAAALIYTYWGPISAFITKLWNDVVTVFNGAINWILNLRMQFVNAGGEIMRGLAAGITGALGSVRDSIMGAADSALQWFKDKLGIRSPSRVFMGAGIEVSNGAAVGIQSRMGVVRDAALGIAAAAAGALPLGAAATGTDALRFDTRPPLVAQSAGAGPAAAGATYHITINAAPGMDAMALARAVSAELDRRDRAARGAVLSTFGDID